MSQGAVPRRHEIFISHSSEDAAIAGEVCTALEHRGFSCWIAPRDIAAGLEYTQSITTAIAAASVVLVLLSSRAAGSVHIRRELELAGRKNLPIIPVRLENRTTFDALDYYVGAQQWCDVIGRPAGSHLGALETALWQRCGDPQTQEAWRTLGGPLAERYARPRPRALLSLDAAGVRGLITLEILSRIEKILASREAAASLRLSDAFDFIGGAGSGGLIAIALARGKTVGEITEFFSGFAAEMFGRYVKASSAFFQPEPCVPSDRLSAALQEFIGAEATLSPKDLHCLLMVMVKNARTNSAWPATNNPLAKYNDPARPDANIRLPLIPFARASVAWSPDAEAETVFLDQEGRLQYTFSDGTFTAYANPAFLLYQMSTSAPFRLRWRRGERNLLLVSIGGGDPMSLLPAGATPMERVLVPFMTATSFDQDVKCREIGRCIHGEMLDREMGDLIARDAAGQLVPGSTDTGKEFTYVRYNTFLSRRHLESLGADHGWDDERSFDLCSPGDIHAIREVGRLVASAVAEEHFETLRP